ncbi:hypothetical protein P154DRAFT_518618 [Amniculicola lignicola CBS 123094]|uniref:Copper transport protein n=1 Tax=Amniculicola lignicola CBS 123094 TaxID=1392246 RepID=A0A6A5WTL4_9PLEO|nr:hypothetical protein P154DRAFT_518618 [Amniculicola lignicola CBS 123094]
MDMSMDMSMSMSDMTTSTTSAMSMATSTGSMDSMDMSSTTSMMGMDTMAMTFFTSTTTPLFSMAWTPNSAGQYAGTCIFLIVLATVFRACLAIRLNLFQFLAVVRHQQNDDVLYGYEKDTAANVRPWRAGEALWTASMDVLLSGIAYLLMIAVMTMNVGYFMSVLGGIFLGSLIFGRFMARSAAH